MWSNNQFPTGKELNVSRIYANCYHLVIAINWSLLSFGTCYHLAIVISFFSTQNDYIKQLPLYYGSIKLQHVFCLLKKF